MEKSIFPKVIFLLYLALGLFSAWFACGQKAIGGEKLFGRDAGDCSCCCDTATKVINCGHKAGKTCNENYIGCDYVARPTGQYNCSVGEGASPHNCLSDNDCLNFKNDLCSS